MRALRFDRSVPRYAAARVLSSLKPGAGASVGPLVLDDDASEPRLPGADWVRVRPRLAGICGSDLASVDGRSSRYFEPIVSFPFVPGHEVVGDLDDGSRVVVEPVLGCVSRGISPVCSSCAAGDLGRCERITFGAVRPGLQSGFCCDTGGGWSTSMVAHRSQLHSVPDELDDLDAVMVEPTACAVHAALAAGDLGGVTGGASVAIIGAGSIGLLTLAALGRFNPASKVIVAAKHPEQRGAARLLGATTVVEPGALLRAARLATGSLAVGDGGIERLTGGVDVVLDCVGSADSLASAMAITRPGGRVVLVGMPGPVKVDLTPLWHREISLVGAYAYGTEPLAGGRRTFDLAFELVASLHLGTMVSRTYPLDDYQDALSHAAMSGIRGAVKIAFDLRNEKERNR